MIGLLRAGAAATMGARRRAASAPAPVTLDLFSGGTFTRSTEGSYLIGAPTDGSSAFLAWALANVRRIENRGDGLGDMLLVEGARTNHVLHSRDVSSAPWTAAGVVTPNDGAGPDGAMLADRIECAAAGFGPYVSPVAGLTAGVAYVASAWMRGGAGSGPYQYAFFDDTGGVGASAVGTLSENWARIEAKEAALGSTTLNTYAPVDGRLNGGFSFSNRALDNVVDLHQIENGRWPSSPIRTAGVAATRAADALSYAVGEYPASFLTDGLRFTLALDFSSAEHIAAAYTCRLISVAGGTHLVQLAISGGQILVGIYESGALRISRLGVTWGRGQVLTFEIRPSAGSLTVTGATTGDGTTAGTPFSWPAQILTVGSHDGAAHVFGRFGRYIEAL